MAAMETQTRTASAKVYAWGKITPDGAQVLLSFPGQEKACWYDENMRLVKGPMPISDSPPRMYHAVLVKKSLSPWDYKLSWDVFKEILEECRKNPRFSQGPRFYLLPPEMRPLEKEGLAMSLNICYDEEDIPPGVEVVVVSQTGPSDGPIYMTGESGVGKSSLALCMVKQSDISETDTGTYDTSKRVVVIGHNPRVDHPEPPEGSCILHLSFRNLLEDPQSDELDEEGSPEEKETRLGYLVEEKSLHEESSNFWKDPNGVNQYGTDFTYVMVINNNGTPTKLTFRQTFSSCPSGYTSSTYGRLEYGEPYPSDSSPMFEPKRYWVYLKRNVKGDEDRSEITIYEGGRGDISKFAKKYIISKYGPDNYYPTGGVRIEEHESLEMISP
jgi:hypothetical protein